MQVFIIREHNYCTILLHDNLKHIIKLLQVTVCKSVSFTPKSFQQFFYMWENDMLRNVLYNYRAPWIRANKVRNT
jgi:hypothetical protein